MEKVKNDAMNRVQRASPYQSTFFFYSTVLITGFVF